MHFAISQIDLTDLSSNHYLPWKNAYVGVGLWARIILLSAADCSEWDHIQRMDQRNQVRIEHRSSKQRGSVLT